MVVPECVSLERLLARLEGLEARVVELEAENAALRKENAALRAENAELKRHLGQNSRNSSKPPSADGPQHSVPPRSLRHKTGRTPGKQPGAQGFSLSLVDDPDQVIDHVPDWCAGCGIGLGAAAQAGVLRRQVTDIAPAQTAVTEHRLHRRRCDRGAVTTAAAPAGVADAAASYGPNLRAWVVYLVVFQHVPVARAVELVTDLSGARPSTGWVCRVLRETAEALVEVEKLIRSLLTAARILHVDETGTKVTGARWWLHVACTDMLTTYHLDTSRGRPAITNLGVLNNFTGIAVHDCWASYNAYTDCDHALCGAHIARELLAAGETHPDQHWPGQAMDCLFALNTAAGQARDQGQTAIPDLILQPLLHGWKHAILGGPFRASARSRPKTIQDPQPPGTPPRPGGRRAALRLRPDRALHQQPGRARPTTGQNPDQDLRHIPLRRRRESLGTHPRLRLHRQETRHHRVPGDPPAVAGNPWTPPLPAT